MQETKIQQRAYILQEVARLKSLPAVSDSDIKISIENLSLIHDKAFLCATLIREIDGSISYFDGVLSILAMNLASNVLEKTIFEFLEKPSVSEEKKLFLINLLRQAGFSVEPNLVHSYIKNVDKLVDSETEKFLHIAELNPEAQIDFLDFYFGINDSDRVILLESIIESYSGDLLANILVPLIYLIKDSNALTMCINGLLNSKSYLAFSPLNWLIMTSNNPSIVSLSKKIKNELKIFGLRKDFIPVEYYRNLFTDSKPLSCFVSSIDGSSNFSLVFARQHKTGAVSTFFAVLNLISGPISCFGLSNISKNEYENILSRFFKDTDKIPINIQFGRLLIDESIELALKNNENVPYELLCWRQLTYDIVPLEISSADYIESCLKDNSFKLEDNDIQRMIGSEYFSKWFYSCSVNYPEFNSLIDKICALNENNFADFEVLTNEFISNSKESRLFFELKTRFFYQAYFLKCLKFKNLSSLFYSVNLDDTALQKVYGYSVKKSVYEFFLSLQNLKDNTDKNNIFAKQKKIKFFDFNSKLMLELIEKKWIN